MIPLRSCLLSVFTLALLAAATLGIFAGLILPLVAAVRSQQRAEPEELVVDAAT